jgi:RNA polymerase sigma-70 factor, ECF subfamily
MEFEAVYQSFHPRILRYLARLVGPDAAEDVAQDVFVKISRSLDGFRDESQPATWIYRIATHAAIDWLRSAECRAARRTVPLEGGCETGPAALVIIDPGVSCENRTIRKEMSTCVQALLKQLPHRYRTVLILSEQEELKDREIAEVLGISVEAAKIRLHRARARLQQSLESQCTFYRDPRNTLLCDRKS